MILVHLTDGKNEPFNLIGDFGILRLRRAFIHAAEGAGDLRNAALLVDVDLSDIATVRKLKELLPKRHEASIWIFACDAGNRAAEVQAGALGATKILPRPVNTEALLQHLGLLDAPAAEPPDDTHPAAASVVSGGAVLKGLFDSLLGNRPVVAQTVSDAAGDISSGMDEAGVNQWLDFVRHHHTGTYQHCMLVTGVATAFAKHLHLSHKDTTLIGSAALVHDVGKARIPVAILDKPGKLTPEEFMVMKMHPVYAYEFLSKSAGLNPEIIAAARHHHEYLNGTGYPDRLSAEKIRDVTRILTIADVFGALIETRSYKPPMPAKDAYAILENMTERGMLERPLVEAFRGVAADIA